MDLRLQPPCSQSCSSKATSSSSSSSRRLSRAVLGLLLCLSLSQASHVSQPVVLGQLDPYLKNADADDVVSLLSYFRALLDSSAQLENESSAGDTEEDGDIKEVKRMSGFGIAGLDNVDMITSTLDRSRAQSRAREGRRYMSSGLTFKQLRALMERAG